MGGTLQFSLMMETEGTTSNERLSVDYSKHHPSLITSPGLKRKMQLAIN